MTPRTENGDDAAPEVELDDAALPEEPVEGEVSDEVLLAEMTERWQRAQADYQNLKRRMAADHEAMLRREVQPLLEGLLLVVDHLEMALASPAEGQEAQNLAVGVRMTRDQLVRTLEEEGVHAVAEDGPFDPAVHQAVATVEDADVAPGHIVQTVRRGYTWNQVVLRAAQVRVAAGPEEGAQVDPPEDPKEGERA